MHTLRKLGNNARHANTPLFTARNKAEVADAVYAIALVVERTLDRAVPLVASAAAPAGDVQAELTAIRRKLESVEATLNEKLDRILDHLSQVGASQVRGEAPSAQTSAVGGGGGLLAQVDVIRAVLGPDIPERPVGDAVAAANAALGLVGDGPLISQVAAITACLGL